MLTALRFINIAVWGVLLVYMLPGAISTVRGVDVRRGDPWRLSVATVCLLMILGNIRWLVAPDNEALLLGVTLLSIAVGGFKIILARAYGRGPKL